ncbi:MAG: NADH-quinone oxidoreductase subunit C [Thermoanaerobaculia bacterium]|nr:NADH-quinone oxidoreductase subunit C [Thermoanaerobaculia bacterium]
MRDVFTSTRNGLAIPRSRVATVELAEFRAALRTRIAAGARLAAFFGSEESDGLALYAILAEDQESTLDVARTCLAESSYPSLTPDCPQAHWFERELAEQYGVTPAGHPWLKPIRFHDSWREGSRVWSGPDGGPPVVGVTDFFQVEGEEVHEVAVGPVHAGVIEPGHFRFQCHGEEVYHLEISLGYQHRGIERALRGGPHRSTLSQMETIAGDTTIGHALAYCQTIEALSGTKPPARAQFLRGIALELERLANHTGDLGALAGDVGYLPTLSFCGRIRGDFLNLTASLCGSRFGRGLVRPGGTGFDLDAREKEELLEKLTAVARDLRGAVELLWATPSVVARFENTGAVSREDARSLGFVGVAARACGVEIDVRQDHPSGIYQFAHIPVATSFYGDVNSRALVRWLEAQQSITYVTEQLGALPQGAVLTKPGPLLPDRIAVSLTEGWRGEICHAALTDADGRIARYKIVDPSFHNWFALALALRGQEISDFPLCNKSFNLSYCGHDL